MTHIPLTLTAGLTFKASFALAKYASPAWSAVLLLRGPSSQDIPAVALPGGGFALAASAAATKTWLPGTYSYALRVTQGEDVHQVEAGQLEVLVDMAGLDGGFDARSQAKRTLDNIEAVLEKRASHDQARYTINNRELWRTPIPELLQLRNLYRAEVRRETAKKLGRPLGRVIKHLL